MGYSRLAKRFTLSDFAYAHRGLWTPAGPAENSLQACLAAAQAGLGIEFDVRPSADGIAMVFHDAILDRMTAKSGMFESYSADELTNIELNGSGQIFSLQSLLEAWPGQTPLLCELKIDGATDPAAFAADVGKILTAYDGPAAAMSFNRIAVDALPDTLMRGQLVDAAKRIGNHNFNAALEKITPERADYIACHTSDAERARIRADELNLPLITWTVRDVETSHHLNSIVDAQIFEGFDPALVKPS